MYCASAIRVGLFPSTHLWCLTVLLANYTLACRRAPGDGSLESERDSIVVGSPTFVRFSHKVAAPDPYGLSPSPPPSFSSVLLASSPFVAQQLLPALVPVLACPPPSLFSPPSPASSGHRPPCPSDLSAHLSSVGPSIFATWPSRIPACARGSLHGNLHVRALVDLVTSLLPPVALRLLRMGLLGKERVHHLGSSLSPRRRAQFWAESDEWTAPFLPLPNEDGIEEAAITLVVCPNCSPQVQDVVVHKAPEESKPGESPPEAEPQPPKIELPTPAPAEDADIVEEAATA